MSLVGSLWWTRAHQLVNPTVENK